MDHKKYSSDLEMNNWNLKLIMGVPYCEGQEAYDKPYNGVQDSEIPYGRNVMKATVSSELKEQELICCARELAGAAFRMLEYCSEVAGMNFKFSHFVTDKGSLRRAYNAGCMLAKMRILGKKMNKFKAFVEDAARDDGIEIPTKH